MTFDYPHHRILLEPNGRFSDLCRKNASGLSVLARGADFHRFEVDGVGRGSPAGSAGIHLGDTLTSLDGYPAGSWTWTGLKTYSGRPGAQFA